MEGDFDYDVLRHGLLEPQRPHLSAARWALAKFAEPEQAWRVLAAEGIVDQGWASDPRRAFLVGEACEKCRGRGVRGGFTGDPDEWTDDAYVCGWCGGSGVAEDAADRPTPDRELVLVLAGSPAAVEAERLAWEVVARLEPWGVAPAERIRWRVGHPGARARPPVLEGVPNAVGITISDCLNHYRAELDGCDEHITIARPLGTRGQPYWGAHWQASAHAKWREAARRGYTVEPIDRLRVGDADAPAHPLVGRSFADLPNPYTPLLGIWTTGFAFDQIVDGVITMYAAYVDA
jgi:hypothetical protein